jgi:general secretion pathway protein G
MVSRVKQVAFTLIELLVVLAVIATLLTLAAPRYFKSVDRSKEVALRENLFTLRDALDKYYADAGRYPTSLDELVAKNYLRQVPVDPLTESATTWILVPPQGGAKGAVYDVKSGATGQAHDGRPFGEL